jgi:hypothetical protein
MSDSLAHERSPLDVRATSSRYRRWLETHDSDKFSPFRDNLRFRRSHANDAIKPAGRRRTPWDSREFVVKDCDGRRLVFGSNAP